MSVYQSRSTIDSTQVGLHWTCAEPHPPTVDPVSRMAEIEETLDDLTIDDDTARALEDEYEALEEMARGVMA